MNLELTLLITTINEADNLRLLLPRLNQCFHSIGAAFEILIIDGHSTDATRTVAESYGARVLCQKGPGYGAAICEGIQAAAGRYLIVMDADLSHLPEDAVNLFMNRTLADIVINSRYMKGGATDTAWYRDLLSRLLNFLFRTILRLPFKEVSGGFRVYRKEVFSHFQPKSRFYEIQEELILIPFWLGFTVAEIPYRYRERVKGQSKAKLLKYGVYLLASIFRFRKEKEALASSGQLRNSFLHTGHLP
ncbi:glycosyltransferase [bacterium]|nr:glycosyltransferase [bacterium]NBW99021.1 glycosyltransferase [bacterium]NBX82078.1 glycosyltransferase [bacterium]